MDLVVASVALTEAHFLIRRSPRSVPGSRHT